MKPSVSADANPSGRRMILCAGMQSGGTTLVSWCFLQRSDTDGELDMANDCIRISFDAAIKPIVWCKMTVGSFRWLEVAEFYADLGWQPEPLLVVRDVRSVFASLVAKPYGSGKTGDKPPLRTKFRRFLLDWELFRQNGWPIMKFEDFLADPVDALRRACKALDVEWDDAMISWPKKMPQIAYPSPKPNTTFVSSMGKGGVQQAIIDEKQLVDISAIPPAELEWLEETFSKYNAFHDYPLDLSSNVDRKGSWRPAIHELLLAKERRWERRQAKRV